MSINHEKFRDINHPRTGQLSPSEPMFSFGLAVWEIRSPLVIGGDGTWLWAEVHFKRSKKVLKKVDYFA